MLASLSHNQSLNHSLYHNHKPITNPNHNFLFSIGVAVTSLPFAQLTSLHRIEPVSGKDAFIQGDSYASIQAMRRMG